MAWMQIELCLPRAGDLCGLRTYQQVAGVLELGLVEHPPVTQIL